MFKKTAILILFSLLLGTSSTYAAPLSTLQIESQLYLDANNISVIFTQIAHENNKNYLDLKSMQKNIPAIHLKEDEMLNLYSNGFTLTTSNQPGLTIYYQLNSKNQKNFPYHIKLYNFKYPLKTLKKYLLSNNYPLTPIQNSTTIQTNYKL